MIASIRTRLALPTTLALLALVVPLAPSAAAVASCQRDASWAEMKGTWATEVLALTNSHRASLGLSPVAPSESLTAAATWKAAHMARYEYMAHDDPAPPVARTWSERIRDCGYSSGAGENIAYGYRTPGAVFQGWLDSDGHRRNIENPSYKVIGVGAAVNAEGTPYWAQVFGLRVETGDALPVPPPPSPAPAPSPSPTPTPAPSPTAPPVHQPPGAADDFAVVAEDERVTILPLANDPGMQTLVSVADPAHGAATVLGNEVEYTPDPDFNGSDSFDYVTTGPGRAQESATVLVRVEPRNDAPDASADAGGTRPRRAVTVTVLDNDSDVDGDRLKLKGVVRAPYYGSVTVDAGSGAIVYRARRGTAGRSDRLTYKVSDGKGGTAIAVVQIGIGR